MFHIRFHFINIWIYFLIINVKCFISPQIMIYYLVNVPTSVGPTNNCGWSLSQGLMFDSWVWYFRQCHGNKKKYYLVNIIRIIITTSSSYNMIHTLNFFILTVHIYIYIHVNGITTIQIKIYLSLLSVCYIYLPKLALTYVTFVFFVSMNFHASKEIKIIICCCSGVFQYRNK